MVTLNPLLVTDLFWDYTLSYESDSISSAKDLILKACKTPLTEQEMKV